MSISLSRRRVLGSLAASLAALSLPRALVNAQEAAGDEALAAQLLKSKLGIRRLAPNLVVLLNAGGNIAVLDGPDGAVVIDAGLPDRAADVSAAVKAVVKNPPGYLINTHYHFDHIGGNAALAADGYRLVATANTRKHLSEKTTIEFLGMTAEALPEKARPAITFKDSISLSANGQSLTLTPIAPAHTDGDAVIFFNQANILHTGDLFFNGFYPFIDYSTGGSLDGMIAASKTLLTMVDDKTQIIPGHGPVGTKADLQTQLDLFNKVRDMFVPLAKTKTEEEVAAAKPLAVLEGKFSKGFLDDEKFTRLIYRCYAKKPN